MPIRILSSCVALGLLIGSARAAESPLADAVENVDGPTIRTLLRQKVDVNTPQADGMTALHWAAYLEDLPAAQALVDAGANVKSTNDYGVAPLSLACQNTD